MFQQKNHLSNPLTENNVERVFYVQPGPCALFIYKKPKRKDVAMEFINSAVDVLQTLVIALGAGLGVWGLVNMLEGYGNDNPGAKSQGIKQLMAGGGIILLAWQLIPHLSGLF